MSSRHESDNEEIGEDPRVSILRGLDYGHSWTFAMEHVVELFQVCLIHPGDTALEIGSFRGHCALAMALADKRVTSIDVSDKHLAGRRALLEQHGRQAEFLIESSDAFLDRPGQFDIILHDNSRRGSALVAELHAYWSRKLNPGGLLIVHNVEQIDLPKLVRRLGPESHIVTSDKRRRQLGYFAKPTSDAN
ncbi:MAG: class I SAM-dependent methyltransferase [Thermomicrobiales bacterium]|nr:class I SAM-dependent methyltransferase [Thermomicrobiales bacterium]